MSANATPTFNKPLVQRSGKTTVENIGPAWGSFVDNGPAGSFDDWQDLFSQADGKLLVAGFSRSGNNAVDYGIARLNTDGSLDTSFGTDGFSVIDYGSLSWATTGIQQTDGKLVLAGQSGTNEWGITRLNADGSLDTSFGTDGKTTVVVARGATSARSLIQQADGKLVLAGTTEQGDDFDFGILRLNTDGSLDTSFGLGGSANLNLYGRTYRTDNTLDTGFSEPELYPGDRSTSGNSWEEGYSVAQQADGKLVIAGGSRGPTGHTGFSIARLNTDGAFDASFGNGGAAFVDVGGYGEARSVVAKPDGTLLLAGKGGNGSFVLVSLNADGSLDTAFGTDGKTQIDTGTSGDFHTMQSQGDGKLLLAGSNSIVRVNGDGTVDTSFGTNGTVATDIGGALVVQPDGRLAVSTGTRGYIGSHTVMRLNADGSVDTSFGTLTTVSGGTSLDASATFTEAGTPVVLDSDVVISDTDLSALNNGAGDYGGTNVTLQRSGGSVTEDVFSGSGNLAFSGDTATLSGTPIGTASQTDGALTIAFAAGTTQAQVNEALSSIAYANSSQTPPASVTLDWAFSDGNTGSQGTGGEGTATGTTTVQITATNTAPVFNGLPTGAVRLLTGASKSLPVAVSDADGDALALTLVPGQGLTLTGLLDADANTDGIQINGTATQINAALAHATISGTVRGHADLQLSVSDGTAPAVTATVSVDTGPSQITTQATGTVTEGGTARALFTLDKPLAADSAVYLQLHGMGATAGVDYSGFDVRMLVNGTWTAATPVSTATFNLLQGTTEFELSTQVLTDSVRNEGNESLFFLVAQATANGALDNSWRVTQSVAISDVLPPSANPGGAATATLTATEGTTTVNEGDGSSISRFSLSAALADDAQVVLNRYGSVASMSADVSGPMQWRTGSAGTFSTWADVPTNGQVTIAAGHTQLEVRSTLVDDALIEGNESFNVVAYQPSPNLTNSQWVQNTVVIADNDVAPPPPPKSVISASNLPENAVTTEGSTARALFTLDKPLAAESTVYLQLHGMGATPDVDYSGFGVRMLVNGAWTETTPVTSATFNLLQGTSQFELTTQVLTDNVSNEGNESLFFLLAQANANGALDNSWRVTQSVAINNAPQLLNLATTPAAASVGQPMALPNIALTDPDGPGARLTLTLTPNGVTLTGLTDSDSTKAGIQLKGTAADIKAELAKAVVTPTHGGHTSVDLSLSDTGGATAVGTLAYTANSAPTFNTAVVRTGTATFDVSGIGGIDMAYKVATLPDGKLLMAGTSQTSTGGTDFSIIRLNADGTLDTSFGTSGKTLIDTGGKAQNDEARSLVTLPDGKLLLAGHSTMGIGTGTGTGTDYSIVRLNADGSLDTSFGTDGKTLIDVGASDVAFGLISQPNGKLLLTGNSTTGTNSDYSMVRLNADGSLDNGFGSGGKALIDVEGMGTGYNLTTQPDGKLLITSSAGGNYSIVRVNADGSLDTSFGTGGKTLISAGASRWVWGEAQPSLVTLPDGKLLLAASNQPNATWSGRSNYSNYSIVRLNADGSLDTSFGTGGTTSVDVGGIDASNTTRSLTTQPDGKLLVAGYIQTSNNTTDFAVVRLNADGSLDTVFGIKGKTIIDASHLGLNDSNTDLSIQPDGRIVLTGYSVTSSDPYDYTYYFNPLKGSDYSIARLNADGSLDTTFGAVTAGTGTTTLDAIAHYTEGSDPVVLDATVAITDADLAALNNGLGDYGGAIIVLARMGGAVADDVFSGSGHLTLAGGTASLSGHAIGAVSQVNGALTLTFAAGTTQAQVNEALSSIAYANTSSTPPASITLGWTFNDGQGNGLGSTGLATGTTTVKVTDTTPVLLGQPIDMPSLNVLDTVLDPNAFLDLTLHENNAKISGITDVNNYAAGIQLIGTSSEIANQLRQATVTPTGSQGSIAISLNEIWWGGKTIATEKLAFNAITPVFSATHIEHSGEITVDQLYQTYPNRPYYFEDRGSLALQTDGKVLVFGKAHQDANPYSPYSSTAFGVVRLNTDGSLDITFGTRDGLAVVGPDDGYYRLNNGVVAAVQQVDGKLVLVGPDVIGTSIARLNADGSVDTSFGANGISTMDLAMGPDAVRNVIQQADGKLVVLGSVDNGNDFNFGVTRFNTDGSLDTTFGVGGSINPNLYGFSLDGRYSLNTEAGKATELWSNGSFDTAYCIAEQADGKLVMAGYSGAIGIARLNTDGSYDSTFGEGGVASIGDRWSSSGEVRKILVQPDGKLLVAGWASTRITDAEGHDIYHSFNLARLNADGSLDTTFGSGGTALVGMGNSTSGYYESKIYNLFPQADGKLLLAGDSSIVRLNADGSADTTFGTQGIVTTAMAESLVVQADGKLLLSSVDYNSRTVMRLNADGSIDTTFGTVTSITTATSLDSTPTFAEGGTAVVLDSTVTLTDTDLSTLNSGVGNYAGASITLAREGGANAQDVFSASGALSLSNGVTSLAGTTIGSYTQSGGSLTLAFDSNATQARLNEALSSIAYANTSDAPPATVSLVWAYSDGRHAAGAELGTTGVMTVNIIATNDVPQLLNLPSTPVNALLGQAMAMPTIDLVDPDGANAHLTLTLNSANAIVSGLADEVQWLPGIQIQGTAAEIKAKLAQAIVTPTAGDVGISLALSDDFGFQFGTSNSTIDITATNPVFSSQIIERSGESTIDSLESGYWTRFYNQDEHNKIAWQPNGKLLVLGSIRPATTVGNATDFGIARLNADGSIDTKFGTNGISSIDFGFIDTATSGIVRVDGKMVITGNLTQYEIGIAQINPDGSLDTSFGTNGKTSVNLAIGWESARSTIELANGKLLIIGSSEGGDDFNFGVVRLNSNGSLDTSFGFEGWTNVNLQGNTGGNEKSIDTIPRNANDPWTIASNDIAYAATEQDDGKLVIVGSSRGLGFSITRLNIDGKFDPTFGEKGVVFIDTPSSSWLNSGEARSVIALPDGKLLVAGIASTDSTSNSGYNVVRLNSDGSLDSSFGNGGKALFDMGSSDKILSIFPAADGKQLLAGTNSIIRLNADGSLDDTFGVNGKVTTEIGGNIFVQPDGKLVLTPGGTGAFAGTNVVRLNANGSIDTTFGTVTSISTYTSLDATPTFNEGGPAVVLDSTVTLTDADLSGLNAGLGNYAGASITLTRESGANAQDVFSGSGALSLTDGVASLAGTTIGGYTQSGGSLTLTFDTNATQARVNETLSSIAYANTSNTPPATVNLVWAYSDGSHVAGAELGTTGVTTVNINATNVAPVFNGLPDGAVRLLPGASKALAVSVADADGDALTLTLIAGQGLTLTGLLDADTNTDGIQINGTVAQINAALANATISGTVLGHADLQLSVSDGTAPAVTAKVSVDTGPSQITTQATGSVTEGGTARALFTLDKALVADSPVYIQLHGMGATPSVDYSGFDVRMLVNGAWTATTPVSTATFNLLQGTSQFELSSHVLRDDVATEWNESLFFLVAQATSNGALDNSWRVTQSVVIHNAPPNHLPNANGVVIGGVADVGLSVTADTSHLLDPDGIDLSTLAYQWLRDGIAIDGATVGSYAVADADSGHGLSVHVSYIDNLGASEAVTSLETIAFDSPPELVLVGVAHV